VAGAVFAQELSIDGFYRVGVDAFGSSSQKRLDSSGDEISDYIRAGAVHSRGRLNFRAANDDGTFGGFVRLQADVGNKVNYKGEVMGADVDLDIGAPHYFSMQYGYAWWQPIEQLKLTAGLFDDFYVNEIVDTFGGVAEDTKVHYVTGAEDGLFLGPFAQQFDDVGLGVGIYPIPGLALNIGVPFGNGLGGVGRHAGSAAAGTVVIDDPDGIPNSGDEIYNNDTGWYTWGETARDVYGHVKIQAVYQLEEIVRIALAFHAVPADSQLGSKNTKTAPTGGGAFAVDNSALFLAGYITALENMAINVGLKFTLPYEVEDVGTYNSPFRIGVGFTFDADAFGIGARLGFALGSSFKPKSGDEVKGPFEFGLNILPYYDLGVCKIFLNAGIHMVALDADYKKAVKDSGADEPKDGFGFHLNPYVEKTIGGGSFFVGFELFSEPFDWEYNVKDGKVKDTSIINWSVPVGMRFSF